MRSPRGFIPAWSWPLPAGSPCAPSPAGHPHRLRVRGTAALLLAAAAAGGTWHVLTRAVLGSIALSGFYLVLAVISPSGMGMGDVKAAAGLGSMLAWKGWSVLLGGGFAGFLFAAVYGTAFLVSGRATRRQQIPFGPFMIAGAFLAVLLT